MKFEIPEYARCCCCFPLRYGLLVWAYTKLVRNDQSLYEISFSWYIPFFLFYLSNFARIFIINTI